MKVLISGICGHMGKYVYDQIQKDENLQYAGGVNRNSQQANYKNVFETFADVNFEADIIIDFSHHEVISDLINFAAEKKIPVVIATTGHTDREKEIIYEASREIPVFFASNFSIGIAVLSEIAKKTALALPNSDIEIIETHHNRKIDAPSGTSLSLAQDLLTVRSDANIVCGRNGNAKRQNNDIGINSVRIGNVVGIHEVQIANSYETITLKHEAHNRAVFAEGAIAAAKFLIQKKPGLYNMPDMFSL